MIKTFNKQTIESLAYYVYANGMRVLKMPMKLIHYITV